MAFYKWFVGGKIKVKRILDAMLLGMTVDAVFTSQPSRSIFYLVVLAFVVSLEYMTFKAGKRGN